MSLTEQLRDELAHVPVEEPGRRRAEAAALVRFGGSLRLRGGGGGRPDVSVVVRCPRGSVARRLRTTVLEEFAVHPGLSRTSGANLTGADAYLVELSPLVLEPLGILDADGWPTQGTGGIAARHRVPYLRGVLMVAGRLSGAGRPVHLEIAAPSEQTGRDLADLLAPAADGRPPSVSDGRVVLKDGQAVSALLGEVGATQTQEAFDAGRQRRALRGRVNRSVNADRANLRRMAESAMTQIAAVQAVVDEVGWEAIPDRLRETALVRLANPDASLAELGRLLDPPVGKATVHRRLKKVESMRSEPSG